MFGLRETTPLWERTIIATRDEILPAVRKRRLNTIIDNIIKLLQSLTVEDRMRYGNYLADIGLMMADEVEQLNYE